MIEPDRPPDTGALIAGIFVGMLLGGTVLTLLSILALSALLAPLGNRFAVAIAIELALALGIGFVGLRIVRKRTHFPSGLLIGLAIGLLGGTAVCGVAGGGLTNVH